MAVLQMFPNDRSWARVVTAFGAVALVLSLAACDRGKDADKAKQAADTFVVRAGDVFSAGLVWLGTQVVALELRGFALANLLLVGLWLTLAALLLREHRALSTRAEAPAGAAVAPA